LLPVLLIADPATPGRTNSRATVATPLPASELAISFDDASRQVSAMLPVELSKMEQVTKNSFNWHGVQDASCRLEIGLSPQALVINGDVLDDFPLVQSRERPLMEDWWEITYGADGLELEFDDPSSATRKLKFLFNFGSAGTDPRVELIQSPAGLKGNPSPGSHMQLEELPGELRDKGSSGFHLRAVIPTARLVEPNFFAQPLRVITRLHDLDGEYSTYLMMQDVLEKP
jgi:hypothetical protein